MFFDPSAFSQPKAQASPRKSRYPGQIRKWINLSEIFPMIEDLSSCLLMYFNGALIMSALCFPSFQWTLMKHQSYIFRFYLIFLSFFLSILSDSFYWNQTFFVSHIMWLMVIFILRGFLKSTRCFCAFKRQLVKSSIVIRNVLMKMEGGLLFNFRLNEELKGFLPKMVLERPSFALYLIYIYTWIEGQILERSRIIL